MQPRQKQHNKISDRLAENAARSSRGLRAVVRLWTKQRTVARLTQWFILNFTHDYRSDTESDGI